MTKLQAHRGVSSECPENTMPAFELAIEQGYAAIELDPIVTRDLQVILHHDSTINRTGRHEDGSCIEETLRVDELTLDEMNTFDFGIHKHPKFRGTKVPLLADVLPKARKAGVQLKIDAKIFKMTPQHQQVLFDLIRDWQDVCALSTKNVEDTVRSHHMFPEMQVHYGGPCTEEYLEQLKAEVPKDKLNLWLPYPNQRTAYAYARIPGMRPDLLQVPELTPERARLARRYGKVGVWNLAEEAEFDQVRTMGIYMAETNGEVKPVRNIGILSDMHTHSHHSHDAEVPVRDMYEASRSRGVRIMAVTDHYDGLLTSVGRYDHTHIVKSCAEAAETDSLYQDGRVLRGVELGEGFWDPEQTADLFASAEFDVVVGSVHALKKPLSEGKKGLECAVGRQNYEEMTARQTYAMMENYFDDVLEMVKSTDVDICAHLTLAVRYFMSRHGIYVGVEQFRDRITEILQIMIQKGLALEVNFAAYLESGIVTPHLWILQLYREMGGYLISMASDAHRPATLGEGFEEGVAILKNLGFRHVFYFENRRPVQCTLL